MIRLVPWSETAERMLDRVPGTDINWLKREYTSGAHVQLWEFADESGRAGYALTRLERVGPWYEWVWLACAGRDFHKFASEFAQPAIDAGIRIRAYVQRPGMRRMYERIGFRVGEYVMHRSY